MAYSLIEHTADTGFRVTAGSVQGLFADAGMALAGIAGASGGRETVRTEVTVEGIDQADLLVRWLQELLYLMEVRRVRISRLEIPELGDTRMTAVVKGEYGSGPPAREIKGVTYHGLEIRRAGGGCEAVIIVDV